MVSGHHIGHTVLESSLGLSDVNDQLLFYQISGVFRIFWFWEMETNTGQFKQQKLCWKETVANEIKKR